MTLELETCNIAELCIELGGSEKLLVELRDKLRYWLQMQPHLPQSVSNKRLEWFILCNKLSLERAKRKLDMYYTMRRLVPEFFQTRDPRGPYFASLHNFAQGVMLPKLGPGKARTYIIRTIVSDAGKYCPWKICKYMFMVADIRMVEDRCFGEHFVFDLSAVNLSHVMKLTPTLMKQCQIIAANAYASWIKGVYFINAPPIVDRLLAMIKPFFPPKIVARIHVFAPGNLQEFYQFIPKSILPKDYGGDEPPMAELSALLFKKVNEWRDWFIENEKILADEDLRPGSTFDGDSLFGFSGSFRKLDID